MNGGEKERRSITGGSAGFYRWIHKNNYPIGYRVLCLNCNCKLGLRYKMISLGIDPSLRSYGFAVHNSEAIGMSRRIASGHGGMLSDNVLVARLMHFRSVIKSLLITYPDIDVVGIESPAYDAGPFSYIHHSLMMFCLEPIFECRRDVVLYDPTTLKYLAKGDPKTKKGIMSKSDMQRKVQIDTMDTKVINNDEADAYLVAYFSARFYSLHNGKLDPSDLTPAEKATFISRTKRTKSGVIKRTAYAFRSNSRFFEFSKIPTGSVSLPKKHVNASLLNYIESMK